ncbi:recombinase family protein [Roseomonas sp. NAR14]|uniref:Recombinase family protein n=1 Tax=Roseomonas acroporae TaxID=2937791 RepID=A0A9X1Y5Z8_9PROT|nr:recombinase family protein [Roseomonas acroporae]MCK8784131.1 recombinase family protein [Roseomonas acroporae]
MGRKAKIRPVSAAQGAPGFVAYYRVSTDKQGQSGLGLEAQREAVERHVRGSGGLILAAFTEVESGKRNDRPQIAAAIASAKAQQATLVIAKLDRLARNVAFISALMDSGVAFVACDNPHATRLTIHILAAVAEHEREMISARTKAALAAAKVRGVKLGNPRLRAGDATAARRAGEVRTSRSCRHAAAVLPFIEAARAAGCESLTDIAAALQARGIRTASGGTEWGHSQVSRVLARASGR